MDKGKKILLLGGTALVLLAVILFMVFSSGGGEDEETRPRRVLSAQVEATYKAVPTDAVLILDFEHLSDVRDMMRDTLNYSYGLIDLGSPLSKLQLRLGNLGAGDCHTIYSLHYSAINEVSLLQVTDLVTVSKEAVLHYLDSASTGFRTFSNTKVFTLAGGLGVSVFGDLMIASRSMICLESSLRHLAGGISVLDNQEFYNVLQSTGGDQCLYINHKQIGKLFSGSVTYSFLKYSDFMMRLSTWSALYIEPRQKNFISFEGELTHNDDLINFSALLGRQKPSKSLAQNILPASTMFAVSLSVPQVGAYLNDYGRYLDANKKYNSRMAEAERVTIPGEPSPAEWIVNEGYTEFVVAFCLVGNKYEWVTMLYHNSTSLWSKITGIKGKETKLPPADFIYKGYLASVLGEAFSHCPEAKFCKVGDWTIIGSANAVGEFFSGRANAVNMDKYLSRTPVSSFFEEPAVARAMVNLKEGADTLFTAFNKYYRGRFVASVQKKNFEYATARVFPHSDGTKANLSFYAANLISPPEMFKAEDESSVFIDSTFKTFYGPFPLVDGSSDTTWFEQSRKYLSISYMDKNKKGIWGIPMKDTIKNYASLVTMPDGKPYITFILGNKLYMMSRRGAHYTGYPVELDCGVSAGPMVMEENGKPVLMILTDQNIITKRSISGGRVEEWKDIHAPEFTRELPEAAVLYGKRYYILRTVSRLRIYTPDGDEVAAKNVKRPVSRESTIEEAKDGYVKVMGVDGKEFLLNLSNGRIKKL